MRAVHWAPLVEVTWPSGPRGMRTYALPGWAVCCSGRQTEQIYEQGNYTSVVSDVTCKRCLTITVKAEDAAARRKKRDE